MKKRIKYSIAIALIVTEILIFFLMPIAISSSSKGFYYVTMWDMILNSSVQVIPELAFKSNYTFAMVIPYLIFILGIAISIGGKKSKIKYTISLICIIISFMILAFTGHNVVFSHSVIEGGYSMTCDNETWLIYYFVYCILAIVYLSFACFFKKK